jgi:serine phosphatase RsbU (regulator of sigma subunit)
MGKNFFITLFLITSLCARTQNLSFSGNAYGFFGEKVILLKKASKNLGFEGPLNGVKIEVKGIDTDLSLQTDVSGAYLFSVPKPGEYIVTVSKEGYSTLNLTINYKDAGSKSVLSLISFVIRKDDKSVNNFGNLQIGDGGTLSFSAPTSSRKNENQDVMQSNKILFEKAVAANNSSKQNIISNQTPKIPEKKLIDKKRDEKENSGPKTNQNDSMAIKHANDLISSLNKTLADSLSSGSEIKEQIELSKKLLGSYNIQDPNYQMLQNQIKNAEAQLALKENYLKVQQKELGEARRVITFMVLMIAVAVLFIGVLFYYFNEKRKFTNVLTEKNKHISKINDRLISSIKYASVIQSNLLMDKEEIKKLFSDSFVYYQPKDILSGDFYWFGEMNGVKILISADCTGHGVPGALLTVLGHGIIEELIEKKKLVSPGNIINELNHQLNLAFSTEKLTEYGIELSVMCFNENEKKVVFASNGGGIYKYSKGELLNYLPVIHRPVKNDLQPKYEDISINYVKDDCFYMMSDGYCDQFKGGSAKPEKYNLRRFETLLGRISENRDMKPAVQELDKELQNWKGTKDQTDDILVVGLRV